LTPEQAQLFLDANYAVVATLRTDGSPHQTAVWVDWDGEHVLLNTHEGRAKARHLRRDPRVSVLVFDGDNWYRWVSVSGTAELIEEGAVEHINKLSHKYSGKDYALPPDQKRIIVRFRPERVTAYGF
jgi:PPOX class probable F420-dependent enzyme